MAVKRRKKRTTKRKAAPKRRRRALSAAVKKALARKAKSSGISARTLGAVYRRGQGAFLSSGSRPGMTMSRWAFARVNSFIRGSRKHDLDLRRRKRQENCMAYHTKPKKKNGKKKKKNGKKKKSGNRLTAAQKKLPMALQRAILRRKKKGKK